MLFQKQIILRGTIVGLLTSLPVMILSLFGERVAGFTFLPFDIFDWLTHILPGPILSYGIVEMIHVIQVLRLGPTDILINGLEQAVAILLFMASGAIFGTAVGVMALYSERLAPAWAWVGGGVMLLFWLHVEAALGFERTSLGAIVVGSTFLALGWAWVLGVWTQVETGWATDRGISKDLSRRRFLVYLGAGGLATLLSFIGIFQYEQKHRGQFSAAGTTSNKPAANSADGSQPTVTPRPILPQTVNNITPNQLGLSEQTSSGADAIGADGRVLPAPGTRAEITANPRFFRVSIDSSPPRVDGFTWRLSIDGLVDTQVLIGLMDIQALPSIEQVSTLSCQFNPVGGDLIGTALWKGTRLRDLLNRAGIKAGARAVNFESLDGYYESVGLDEVMDERALLIYSMNGAPLSADHGFPLRLYLPDRYGMKQPKWLSRIKVTDQPDSGYWRDRQWDSDARVATTAVIDAVAVNQIDPKTGTVPVGGIAFAGARGIRKVEIQIDAGPWMPVTLRSPALSQSCWVQWRFNAPYKPGPNIFRVRATDGAGALQTDKESGGFPAGATGIFSYQITL